MARPCAGALEFAGLPYRWITNGLIGSTNTECHSASSSHQAMPTCRPCEPVLEALDTTLPGCRPRLLPRGLRCLAERMAPCAFPSWSPSRCCGSSRPGSARPARSRRAGSSCCDPARSPAGRRLQVRQNGQLSARPGGGLHRSGQRRRARPSAWPSPPGLRRRIVPRTRAQALRADEHLPWSSASGRGEKPLTQVGTGGQVDRCPGHCEAPVEGSLVGGCRCALGGESWVVGPDSW
jgi:hypothetical protein